MSDELRARVLAAAAAEPSATRAAVSRRNLLFGVLAAASGIAAFMVFAECMSESVAAITRVVKLRTCVRRHRRAATPGG